MRILYLMLNLFCFLSVFGSEGIMVKYHIVYRNYEGQQPPKSEEQTLWTDGNQSVFIGKTDTVQFMGNEIIHYDCPYIVYKNIPEEGKLTYMESISSSVPWSYVEDIPAFEWNFLDGDTTIASYSCKKASMTFRGRSWTVWYAMDIPVGEGPWKLCGLPGMILYAADSKGDFSFEAMEIKPVADVVINVAKSNKSSISKIEHAKKLEYSDPPAYYREILNITFPSGYKYEPHTVCRLEYIEEK